MLHYISGTELNSFPTLRHSMFMDRKRQFVDRLKWPLRITKEGYEIDEYDGEDTTYLICSDNKGRHTGSMRLIPSTLRTMTRDHFSQIIPGINFDSDLVWECTRFCISACADKAVSFSLLAGAAKLMRERKLQAFLGVFDAGAERAYRRVGAPPFVLGTENRGKDKISVGLWRFDEKAYAGLVQNSLYELGEYDRMYSSSAVSNSYISLSEAA